MSNFSYLGNCMYENRASFRLPTGVTYENACLVVQSAEGVVVGLEKTRDGKKFWTIPGGKRDRGENSPIVTAIREFDEEVGGNGRLDFSGLTFACYGKFHVRSGVWTVMAVVTVEGIRHYTGDIRFRDRELVGVGLLPRIFGGISSSDFDRNDVNQFVERIWVVENEGYNIQPKLKFPDLFYHCAHHIRFF